MCTQCQILYVCLVDSTSPNLIQPSVCIWTMDFTGNLSTSGQLPDLPNSDTYFSQLLMEESNDLFLEPLGQEHMAYFYSLHSCQCILLSWLHWYILNSLRYFLLLQTFNQALTIHIRFQPDNCLQLIPLWPSKTQLSTCSGRILC